MLTGDAMAAEDLLQTALAKAWPHWDRVSREGDPTAYIQRVMVNTYRSWWRRKWRAEVPTADVPDRVTGPDAFAAADDRERVRRALDRLPRRQRSVLVLRFFEDLTEAQAAAVLDCSIGTVKSQTAKARAALRDILGEDSVPSAERERS
jgi:RNA polymerase sigma-70 factor (sigma-E family)